MLIINSRLLKSHVRNRIFDVTFILLDIQFDFLSDKNAFLLYIISSIIVDKNLDSSFIKMRHTNKVLN